MLKIERWAGKVKIKHLKQIEYNDAVLWLLKVRRGIWEKSQPAKLLLWWSWQQNTDHGPIYRSIFAFQNDQRSQRIHGILTARRTGVTDQSAKEREI